MKKKKNYLALAHSLRGLRERLKYRLSSGEGSKMLDFQMVATVSKKSHCPREEQHLIQGSSLLLALIITILVKEPSQCST